MKPHPGEKYRSANFDFANHCAAKVFLAALYYWLPVVYNVKDNLLVLNRRLNMKARKGARVAGIVIAVIMALLMVIFMLLPYLDL